MTSAPMAAGLAGLARARTEWRPWLVLLDAANHAARDGAWRGMVPGAPARTDESMPLLAAATLIVDARVVRRWLRALLATAAATSDLAAPLAAARADTARLVALLEAGLGEDAAWVAAIAAGLAADAGAVGAVAGVAPVPLLRACAGVWADRIPPAWDRGCCPVCGTWPAFAEARGLERARRLRCGRCAADWATPWLRCPYCGCGDHERLGSLVITQEDADGTSLRLAPVTTSVDTCGACRGYLKTVTTLAPTPAEELGLLDLASVDLDAAALARGYVRPRGPGSALGARVITRGGGTFRDRWWRA